MFHYEQLTYLSWVIEKMERFPEIPRHFWTISCDIAFRNLDFTVLHIYVPFERKSVEIQASF